MSALAPRDTARLAELETTIAMGLETFVEVGAALAEIRESRLYREYHRTFEEYCAEKWRMTDRQARRLIGSSEVVRNLSETGPIGPVPTTESMARPLAALPREQQQVAWRQAVETAPKDDAGKPKVTAAHVENVAREVAGKPPRDVLPITPKPETAAQMAASAVRQQLHNTEWGVISGFIVDLPLLGRTLTRDVVLSVLSEDPSLCDKDAKLNAVQANIALIRSCIAEHREANRASA